MSVAHQLPDEAAREPVRCTRDEYLARERSAETKSEYYTGEAWPMVGASLNHIRIVRNLVSRLTALTREPLEVLSNDLRVRATPAYFYPDIVILNGEPQLEDTHQDTLLNPAVIIEVLSPSTEAFDRGQKFAAYRTIPTLQEYALVSQNRPRVEHYRRLPGDAGQWVLTVVEGLEAVLLLLEHAPDTVPCQLPLREIYDRIPLIDEEQPG